MNKKHDYKKECEELKKQLEENTETLLGRILELRGQQKKFIKYLEDYLKLFDKMNIDDKISYDMIEEVLQKYKEIIGGK